MTAVATAVPRPRSRAALEAEVTAALSVRCPCGKVPSATETLARELLARLHRDRHYPVVPVRFYPCPLRGAWHWTRDVAGRRPGARSHLAGPVGPSCTDGDHGGCWGYAWDTVRGAVAPCSCCARHAATAE